MSIDQKEDEQPKKEKKTPKYSTERVIGSGSFGVVYKSFSLQTNEIVAIKKIREDQRYKNRELQIMKAVKHPNVVLLKDCFYSKANKDIFLNLVMEYIPETLYVTIRNHAKAGQTIPYMLIKIYTYQICRALAYCHSKGICHRDIKPQNLLLNPDTHTVKLCDFGSAKKLKDDEPNVSYICSRYYRAPELIFESTFYKTTVDLWSIGCVIGEMFLGTPLFQGEKSVDQLVEIIKILGTPTKKEIMDMNPHYTKTKFPEVKPLPWKIVFSGVSYDGQNVPVDAIDLISRLLSFSPHKRIDGLDALGHFYFDELRNENCKLPHGGKLPPCFNFTDDEIKLSQSKGILHKIIPKYMWKDYDIANKDDD